MLEILHHSLIDTVKLFPWLLLIYIIIELLERKTNLAGSKSRFGGSLGPLVGSATGLVPQCGFSVMAAKLFEQKYHRRHAVCDFYVHERRSVRNFTLVGHGSVVFVADAGDENARGDRRRVCDGRCVTLVFR